MTQPVGPVLIFLGVAYLAVLLLGLATGAAPALGGNIRRLDSPPGFWIMTTTHAFGFLATLALALVVRA
ncbi:MAG TPA: hypothetical protein VKC17_08035 [Sphingomicrobium sp.]|nr:hypothetical protein [Sphingomicrobium sp.]